MIELVPFRKEFENQVIKLILDIQQLEFNIPITAEDQPDLRIIDDFYRKNGGEFWIALDNNQVVGSIALIRIANNTGVIRKMFVKKSTGVRPSISLKIYSTPCLIIQKKIKLKQYI